MHYGGRSLGVPLRVVDASKQQDVSFKLDVMPVFMKAGCNAGTCHGSARGQDGFRLSLFGFDPDGDYHRITREFSSRRIDLAVPAASLIMEKPLGRVPHTGGERFSADSSHYKVLIDWLEAGARKDPADLASPLSLEIHPTRCVLEGDGTRQRLTVRARYSDGTDRDVTDLAVFLSNNDTSASVDGHGLVTAHQRGEDGMS